jgi:hypothetical protein
VWQLFYHNLLFIFKKRKKMLINCSGTPFAEVVEKWEETAKSLPEEEQRVFISKIKNLAKSILNEMQTYSLFYSPKELEEKSKFALLELDSSAAKLFRSQGEYLQGQKEVKSGFAEIDQALGVHVLRTFMANQVRNDMRNAEMLAGASRAVGEGIEFAVRGVCGAHPEVHAVCRKGKKLVQEGVEAVPKTVIKFFGDMAEKYEEGSQISASAHERLLGIPREETLRYHDNVATIFGETVACVATAGVGKVVAMPIKMSTKRINYIIGYKQDAKNFIKFKEFAGKLSKDLYVVQYHSGAKLGEGRSLQWWTSTRNGNTFFTIEEVMERLQLMSSWGERTHVTLAKIPANVKVQFLYGKAALQAGSTGEITTAGQLRFLDFDPGWILETRKLP